MTSITRHDINNKISVILGYLELVKKNFNDPALVDYLNKLDSATKSIRSQIEFTKLYQELGAEKPRWQELEPLFSWSEVPPTISLKADVRGLEIFADLMLGKVFFNLLDNSIRHGRHVTEIDVTSVHSR